MDCWRLKGNDESRTDAEKQDDVVGKSSVRCPEAPFNADEIDVETDEKRSVEKDEKFSDENIEVETLKVDASINLDLMGGKV